MGYFDTILFEIKRRCFVNRIIMTFKAISFFWQECFFDECTLMASFTGDPVLFSVCRCKERGVEAGSRYMALQTYLTFSWIFSQVSMK